MPAPFVPVDLLWINGDILFVKPLSTHNLAPPHDRLPRALAVCGVGCCHWA
jgi:hypothetical protein